MSRDKNQTNPQHGQQRPAQAGQPTGKTSTQTNPAAGQNKQGHQARDWNQAQAGNKAHQGQTSRKAANRNENDENSNRR